MDVCIRYDEERYTTNRDDRAIETMVIARPRNVGRPRPGADDAADAFDTVLLRARQGDGLAFEHIFHAYAGRVRAFAIARGAQDADAITNDVMLRVFQNLGSFTGDEPAFVRWIFTVARNRLIDVHRAEQRRPVIVDAVIPEQTEPSAESLALDRMSIADVADRLRGLTIDQREVIALRLVHDLSLKDVAEIVDRPVTAVKALQRRGLRALERQILDEGVS